MIFTVLLDSVEVIGAYSSSITKLKIDAEKMIPNGSLVEFVNPQGEIVARIKWAKVVGILYYQNQEDLMNPERPKTIQSKQ